MYFLLPGFDNDNLRESALHWDTGHDGRYVR